MVLLKVTVIDIKFGQQIFAGDYESETIHRHHTLASFFAVHMQRHCGALRHLKVASAWLFTAQTGAAATHVDMTEPTSSYDHLRLTGVQYRVEPISPPPPALLPPLDPKAPLPPPPPPVIINDLSTTSREQKSRKFSQSTLYTTKATLRLSTEPPSAETPRPQPEAVAAAPLRGTSNDTNGTSAAGDSSKHRDRTLDQQQPVVVSLHIGPNAETREWAWVHLEIKPRRHEVNLSAKRAVYTLAQKSGIVAQTKGLPAPEAVKRVREIPGFDKVDAKQIRRWRKEEDAWQALEAEQAAAPSGFKRKRREKKHAGGRKVNTAFKQAVVDELIFTSLEKVDGAEKAVVEANVMYSHALIVSAAESVKQMEQFKDDAKVRSLEFSRPWIRGLLRRAVLRRRRITATEKDLPAPAVVQARMVEIQDTIVSYKFTKAETISADETGIFFGAAPKYQIIPKDAARATAPESDDKARFTAMLFGTGEVEMGPLWAIIKCTVKGFDLSSARVLITLHLQPGFTVADGWELKMWERELTLPIKGKKGQTQTVINRRPYLINAETLEVITIQHKAWMDTAGICMWSEIQLKPWAARRTGRVLVVWDNCGPHKTEAVKAAFARDNITQEELTPKMTDILQVMDLIANGPVKAGIRRDRCEALFDEFQNWKIARLKAQAESKPLPKFTPSKPKITDGLRILRKVCKSTFERESFKQSMRECFVNVGLAPFKGTGGAECPLEFYKYRNHRKGTMMPIKKIDTSDETSSLGEIVAELAMEQRNGADSDGYASDEIYEVFDDEEEVDDDEEGDDDEGDDNE